MMTFKKHKKEGTVGIQDIVNSNYHVINKVIKNKLRYVRINKLIFKILIFAT